ncbi:MAG: hypothetical protein Q9161_001250 [Pseudevernia consocians]
MTEPTPTLESNIPELLQTSGPFQACEKCVLNAAATTYEAPALDTAAQITGSSSKVLVFTAISVTSAYSSNGLCITTSGSSLSLFPEYTITYPATADPTAFRSSATLLLYSRLSFTDCAGSGQEVLPTALTQVSNLSTISADPLPSTTLVSSASNVTSSSPTTSSATENISSRFTTRDKAATGIVVSVVAIISLVLGILFYLRRRRKRSNSGEDTHVSEEETQPYLQQKAELDAEEKRRLELEAVEVRYELDGRDHRNEMPAQGSEVGNEIDTIERPAMSSLKERHELKGEECSKELEAS